MKVWIKHCTLLACEYLLVENLFPDDFRLIASIFAPVRLNLQLICKLVSYLLHQSCDVFCSVTVYQGLELPPDVRSHVVNVRNAVEK